jgi:hypothetical protein
MSPKPTSTKSTTPSVPDLSADDAVNQTTPKSGGFKGVLKSIGKGAANILLPGLGNTLGGGLSASLLGATMPGLGSSTTQYLVLQQQMQQQQLAFETMSTVLKCRADASMSAIRNMQIK